MKILVFSFFIQLLLFNSNCVSIPKNELCYPDRKVTEDIKDISMECILIGNDPFLAIKSESKRYQVCNAEKFNLEEGKTYIVNGFCFEIKSNERWAGTPFQLKTIKPQ